MTKFILSSNNLQCILNRDNKMEVGGKRQKLRLICENNGIFSNQTIKINIKIKIKVYNATLKK